MVNRFFHRWLSADKGDTGTSLNVKVVPQSSSKPINRHSSRSPSTVKNLSTPQRTSAPVINTHLRDDSERRKRIPTKNVTIAETTEMASPGHVRSERQHTQESDDESYEGEGFESVSEDEEEEGSQTELEQLAGERSDVEADRHDIFDDTQELDSSITNEYLQQLRCVRRERKRERERERIYVCVCIYVSYSLHMSDSVCVYSF